MPAYPWLIDQELDNSDLVAKMKAMQTLGVPYTDEQVNNAVQDALNQADVIVADLAKNQVDVKSDREIIALIAYLQRLGTDIKATTTDK